MTQSRYVLALLVLLSPVAGHPATAEEAAGGYEVAQMITKRCRAEYQLAALQSQTTPDKGPEGYKAFLACKAEASKNAKQTYDKLSKILKTADGKRALKEFHAAFMASVEGSEPRDGERQAQFTSRIAALDGAVEMAWQKLRLEF